uniref:Naringenin-chalcone synthase n=1 Tax=Jahnella sp. MSr9139 TaxID=1434086 RepID=A0A3Q8I2B4_9BACT|nr:naringenin-chalcone synthase [Jahnella sp. MSr9139]
MPHAPGPEPVAAIRAVERRLPPHYAPQERILGALRDLWATRHHNLERLEDLHRSVLVSGRHLALPLEAYPRLETFQQRNDAWIRAALALAEDAARGALERAGLGPRDIDQIFFVTVTGLATPSIDARLVNRLGLRADVRRTPIFGLGCVAGAAVTARAADALRGFPGHAALLVAVELCSLTLQREDLSIPNIIASGLFGDGAAAVVLEGAARAARDARAPGPRVVASRSVFYPDTERVMGWDVVDTGFKVVLSAKVPELVRSRVRADVDAFLAEHGLQRSDIRHWVAHTGGPKVLSAMEEALELPPQALARSWASLREVGNLSSASVLFVLGETMDAGAAEPGDWGVMMAMGPGFCAELVLLRW